MSLETVTLDEIQKDIDILRLALGALQIKVDQLRSQQQKAGAAGRPTKLTDLEGILGGVNLSYEEIEATWEQHRSSVRS